jgi:hypothetical protein
MSASFTSNYEIQTGEFNLNNIGWSTGEFHFRNQNLMQILDLLETYYPVRFIVGDKYKDIKLSFHVSNMKLDSVLSLIQQLIPGIEFEKKGERIIIN